MFRGIEPGGLDRLANQVETSAASVRFESRMAQDLLTRNGLPTPAGAIGAIADGIQRWGSEAAGDLRWRAAAIHRGQHDNAGFFEVAWLRFATEAVFTGSDGQQRDGVATSSKRTGEAIAAIADWLSQGLTDWDVTNGDLHNVWAALEGLSATELDGVIAALTPHQLERWIEEMGNGGNGLSRDEKQQIFAMLADNSSGQSLGKIHDAILAVGSSDDAVDLGMAIRHHSPDEAIVDFVIYVVGHDLATERYSGVAPALTASGIEDSRAIDTAIRAILSTTGALEAIVVDNMVTARIEDTGTACVEIAPLGSLITAMNRGSDPEIKALGFTLVATLAGGVDERLSGLLRSRHVAGSKHEDSKAAALLRPAAIELTTAASRLLLADTEAIVRHLATSADVDGSTTAGYFRQLIDQGLISDLAPIVDALRGGKEVDAVRFSAPGTEPTYPYPHAQDLAFVAGALNRALEQYAAAAKDEIGMVATAAQFASMIAGFFFVPAFLSVEMAAGAVDVGVGKLGTDRAASSTQEDIDRQLANVIHAVETEMRPQLPLDVNPENLGEALLWWEQRYSQIIEPDLGS